MYGGVNVSFFRSVFKLPGTPTLSEYSCLHSPRSPLQLSPLWEDLPQRCFAFVPVLGTLFVFLETFFSFVWSNNDLKVLLEGLIWEKISWWNLFRPPDTYSTSPLHPSPLPSLGCRLLCSLGSCLPEIYTYHFALRSLANLPLPLYCGPIPLLSTGRQ